MSRSALPCTLLAVLLTTLAWADGARAHGTEREYGKPINGQVRKRELPPAPPQFVILLLESKTRRAEEALAEERFESVAREAREIVRLSRELRASVTSGDAAHVDEAAARADVLATRGRELGRAAQSRQAEAASEKLAAIRGELVPLRIAYTQE